VVHKVQAGHPVYKDRKVPQVIHLDQVVQVVFKARKALQVQ
jgi:hypothetical protein